mmetsp:Transcript_54977/g.66185  ORF Transcript_54977/g.66185 Transcript_54977/m.66185 type:complete len:113 (+) Transcript_54977:245-583(+)
MFQDSDKHNWRDCKANLRRDNLLKRKIEREDQLIETEKNTSETSHHPGKLDEIQNSDTNERNKMAKRFFEKQRAQEECKAMAQLISTLISLISRKRTTFHCPHSHFFTSFQL